MKEATPVAGKMIPPTGNKRGVNSSKGPKQKIPQEMEHTAAHQDKSPPRKKKVASSKSSPLESTDLFEATIAGLPAKWTTSPSQPFKAIDLYNFYLRDYGAHREVSMLFSKYAEVLSERAALDASQVKELEGILMEARNLECHLKEKKDHLRRTLALISDQLQG